MAPPEIPPDVIRRRAFHAELHDLIIKYGIERESETPASLLIYYFDTCLAAFEATTIQRDYRKRVGWGRPHDVPPLPDVKE